MEDWYVHSGVANSGQNRAWQNKFRHSYTAPTIQSVPPIYTPLQYIQSDGSQYIDTEVKPYQTKVEIAFAYSGTGQTGTKNICGCWNANNNRFYVCWCNATVIGTTNRSNTNIALQNPWDNFKHFLIYNDANNKIIFDNVEKGTISDLTTESSSTIYLFSMNYNGSYNPAISKIYRVRITNKATNTIVKDFIPVLDQSNVPCMLDLIENKFYYNKGTGSFSYSY